MGSPVPDAIKYKLRRNDDGGSPTTEEVGELYKSSYRKFIQNFAVQNDKVRYYCNKTMAMRQPLHAIIDDLTLVQQSSMAYLDQVPRESDHYLLATIFTVIQKVANTISWKTMGHKCYWQDFRREIRQLRLLIGKAEVANLECCHTVVDKAKRAMEILEEFKSVTKIPDRKFEEEGEELFADEWDTNQTKMKNSPFGFSGVQQSGPPSEDEIIIVCSDGVLSHMEWINQESAVQKKSLLDASDVFRIRLLRSLIYCAHKSLQLLVLTMYRIDISLRTEFSLDKLEKCDGIYESELLPHERIVIKKSKKEFDTLWDNIMGAVCRFRLQLIQLRKHDKVFKLLVKNPKYSVNIPKSTQLNLRICEQLLLKFAFEAEPEELGGGGILQRSRIYSDRTSDVITMIQDMWWIVDKTSLRDMNVLIGLLFTALTTVFGDLSTEERMDVKNRLDAIFQQRDKVMKYLKKSVKVFGHPAFQDMPTINNSKRFKSITKMRPSTMDTLFETNSNESGSEEDQDGGGQDKPSSTPVHLQGGFHVYIGEQKEFFVSNLIHFPSPFSQLTGEEQVLVTRKMCGCLYHYVTSEACLSKNVLARATETKSLVKRLEPKDRINDDLIANLTNGLNHIKNMFRLMKEMNTLLPFIKKA